MASRIAESRVCEHGRRKSKITGSCDSRAVADSTIEPANSTARVQLCSTTRPSEQTSLAGLKFAAVPVVTPSAVIRSMSSNNAIPKSVSLACARGASPP